MPTDAERTELRKKCTWTWVTNYNGSGLNGRLVKATNGNSIFLPAAGLHRQGSKAVLRYTMLELKDRFALMCAAFGEEQYKVDDRFEVVSV